MMRQRSLLIDLLKIIGSQLIVLHHLVLYSPMAKIIETQLPDLVNFLFFYARLPVWSFLVIGGFLCAHLVDRRTSFRWAHSIFKRCLRLLPLYFFSIFSVVIITIVWHPFIKDEPWVSPVPSLLSLFSHLLLLQDVIGEPAISAGAWYVSIDLQLFSLTLALIYLSRFFYKNIQIEMVACCIFLGALASLQIWSKEDRFEIYAFYFFNAYGLGLLAYLAKKSRLNFYFFLVLIFAHAIDVFIENSFKNTVILITALTVYLAGNVYDIKIRIARLVESASNTSHALFVSHFCVIIIFTGIWNLYELDGFVIAGTMFFSAWVAATLNAYVLNSFYLRMTSLMSKSRGGNL